MFSFEFWEIFNTFSAGTDVTTTSSGSLKKFTTPYDQTRRPKDVWQKTSHSQRFEYVRFTTSWHRLKDVRFTTSWRHIIYVLLKRSDLRYLEGVFLRLLEDVWFMTSWRRRIYVLLKTSGLQCLEDVCCTTSWRRL